MMLLAILLQAATPAAAAPVPQRFSILEPVANERCARKAPGDDIVVCGDPIPSQALPYPEEIVPDHPVPVNPDLSSTVAMSGGAVPCGAVQGGCTVGFGPPIMPIVAGAVDLVKGAFKKKPDKRGRVPIPLEDPIPGKAQP